MPVAKNLARLLQVGTQHASNPRARRRLVINNGLALALGGSTLFYSVLLSGLGFGLLGALLVPVALAQLSAVWLNHLARTQQSNLLTIFAGNTVVFGYLLLFGLDGEVSPFFVTICLPLVVAELSERRTIVLGCAVSVGYAIVMVAASHHVPAYAVPAAATASGLRFSLTLLSLAMLLLAVLSFVISNARAESSLDRARAGLQRLLDSVNEGFVTVDARGRIGAERSSVFDVWFDQPPPGTLFSNCLVSMDPDRAACFSGVSEQIEAAYLPIEVLLDQLPRSLEVRHCHLRVTYRPELRGEQLTSLLIVMSDVTAEVERERLEAEQRELVQLMTRFATDRHGVAAFVQEADRLVESLRADGDRGQVRRAVHTLKGNCAFFGVQTVAQRCHVVETRLAEPDSGEAVSKHLLSIVDLWHDLRARIDVFVGQGWSSVSIDRRELEELQRQARLGLTSGELVAKLETWAWEPTSKSLERLAEQLRVQGRALGKGDVVVAVEGGGLRLDPGRWGRFWACLPHVLRNALDHGLETPAQREASGKGPARVALRTRCEDERLLVEVEEDNGRGVDWTRVSHKAHERGLKIGSPEALEKALFSDGLSTRDTVSETSGRGVGLNAVYVACQELGGCISVDSELGRGTCFRFAFPALGVARPVSARP